MVGSVERKMKARIYQRRRRNTLKGSILLKSFHNKQDKRMKNLFTRKGINTEKNYDKPLTKLEQRQLADFIRKIDSNSKELYDDEAELEQLENTKKTEYQYFNIYMLILKTNKDLTSEQRQNIISKMEECVKNITQINKDIDILNEQISKKLNKSGKTIHDQKVKVHKSGIRI